MSSRTTGVIYEVSAKRTNADLINIRLNEQKINVRIGAVNSEIGLNGAIVH